MFTRITLFMAIVLATAATAQVEHHLVRELYRNIAWPALEFVGDKMYTIDLDSNFDTNLEVYNVDGTEHLKTIKIAHSSISIASFGSKGVIVVGRRSDDSGWSSHVSIVTESNGSFRVKHISLGRNTIVETAVSNGTDIYFNEKGTRGLFKLVGSRLKRLNVEVSGPGRNMQFDDEMLHVVELRDLFFYGDESIFAFDTTDGTSKRLNGTDGFGGLRNIKMIDGNLVGTEMAADTVIFVDKNTGATIARQSVKPGVYGIERYGKCAVVTSEDEKSLSFIRLKGSKAEIVGSWDMRPAGERLQRPRKLAVDASSGRIFVQSTYVCPSCTVSNSSVFSFIDDGSMLAACQ